VDLRASLAATCRRFGVDVLYVFGSRAAEVSALVQAGGALAPSASDVDIGALPEPSRPSDATDRVRLTIALEDLLGVHRVDLVILPEADPFLALDVVSGELLYCGDAVRQAEYELYALRRAGDLAPFERERRARLLTGLTP
jgi:predicted nucleotidyltransferase